MALFDIVNYILPFVYCIYLKFSRLGKKTQDRAIMFLYSVQIIIMVGTRTIITGDDTPAYYDFYQHAAVKGLESSTLNEFEPLFSLIALVCAKLRLSFTVFNIIIAAITMWFFSASVLKMECNAFVCVLLYTVFGLHLNMMNQVRQALAMMIVLYAVTFLKDGHRLRFVIWTFIAALFHFSSLVALILLPLWNVRLRRTVVSVYTAIGVFCTFAYPLLFRFIQLYFYYGAYLDDTWRYEALDSAAILNFAVRAAMLIFAAVFYHDLYTKDKNINGYYHMAIICTILQLLTVYNNAIGRITTVFFLAYIFIISKIVDTSFEFKVSKPILYPLLIAGFTVYYCVYLGGKAIDYQSVLF